MPFDVAITLGPVERAAYVIVLGTLNGHDFNWPSFEWAPDRDPPESHLP